MCGVSSIAVNSKPQVTQNQSEDKQLELGPFGLNRSEGGVGNYGRCGKDFAKFIVFLNLILSEGEFDVVVVHVVFQSVAWWQPFEYRWTM